MKTKSAKREQMIDNRAWFVVDATGISLGRLASTVAYILRGKHKPIYTAHVDTGDHVIVINADKVKLTGNKREDKLIIWHTSHPGGMRTRTLKQMMESKPEKVIKAAVKGMLPHNILGRAMFNKLKVYRDADHPHTAQNPKSLAITENRFYLTSQP